MIPMRMQLVTPVLLKPGPPLGWLGMPANEALAALPAGTSGGKLRDRAAGPLYSWERPAQARDVPQNDC
jgi:hypothetical protein